MLCVLKHGESIQGEDTGETPFAGAEQQFELPQVRTMTCTAQSRGPGAGSVAEGQELSRGLYTLGRDGTGWTDACAFGPTTRKTRDKTRSIYLTRLPKH